MTIKYNTTGVCAKEIQYDIIGGKLYNVKFIGGCPGNTIGVARLIEGKQVEEVIKLLEGVKCGFKPTSCQIN